MTLNCPGTLPQGHEKEGAMRSLRRLVFLLVVLAALGLSACVKLPPGHDPAGPGNSEHAPGQHKDRHK